MRWSLELPSPNVAAFPQDQGRNDDVFSADAPAQIRLADGSGRKAAVGVFGDATTTEFVAWVENPCAGGFRPPHPEWWFHDHLVVFLNPGHDHAQRLMYAVSDDGRLIREAEWTVPGEEPGDLMSVKLETPAAVETEFRRLDERRFAVRLRLPTKVCFPCFSDDEATPTGLALKIGFLEQCLPAALSWPPVCPWAKDQPLIFGDLHRVPPRLSVEALELREPTWGGNPCFIRLRGQLREHSANRGEVRIRVILPGDSEQEQTSVQWQAENDVFFAEVPVVFPFRAKWANGLSRMARLRLQVEDAAGRTLWKAEYPFGFDGGIIIRERFGAAGADLPPRPQPTDPAFLDRFREYVLARLPAYRARTTAAGAPSDFFLEDPAGKDSFTTFTIKSSGLGRTDRWFTRPRRSNLCPLRSSSCAFADRCSP